MKHISNTKGPWIAFLLLFSVSFGCRKELNMVNPGPAATSSKGDVSLNTSAVVLSQTRTATVLNNFGGVYVNSFPKATAQNVAANDNVYAYSNRLSKSRWYASLALQGFGFTVPDNATIENIVVTVRRFKTGASIKDYFVSAMQRYGNEYGAEWTNLDTYPGNYYPNTEGEVLFSQSGSGNNGGYYHDQAYQWTPSMVNHPYFGLRVDVYPISGAGNAIVYYDFVQIKVEYSLR